MGEPFYSRKNRQNNGPGDDYHKMINSNSQMMQGFNHSGRHPGNAGSHQQPGLASHNVVPQFVNLIPPQLGVSQAPPNSQYNYNNISYNTPYLQSPMYPYPGQFNMPSNTGPNYGTGMRYAPQINNAPRQNMQNYYKERKQSGENKSKHESHFIHKPVSYPVRLLVNTELVGPIIGRKGEKIKEITTNTGAKIDIKRENVPYNQFGLNNLLFSGCGGSRNMADVAGDGESQIVFITGESDKCSLAVEEIMKLCVQTAAEQERPEPALGLLAEDRFCARLIGKEGRNLNVVRMQAGCQIHVSNVPTITTLSQSPHIISLDRIINCKGSLKGLLEAEKMISEKIKNCVSEDAASGIGGGTTHLNSVVKPKPHRNESSGQNIGPPQNTHNLPKELREQTNRPNTFVQSGDNAGNLKHKSQQSGHKNNYSSSNMANSGIVHKANPNWPDNLKLDENLYVRVPQGCAGSIIGSEGKAVRRIMAETGTYVQVSKTNLSALENIPAVHTYKKQPIPTDCSEQLTINNKDINEEIKAENKEATEGTSTSTKISNHRLLTIKGSSQCQSSALGHIFQRVQMCYASQNIMGPAGDVTVRLWVIMRIPKLMLGRLIGKDGKVIRHLQANTKTFLSFPKIWSDEIEEVCESEKAATKDEKNEEENTDAKSDDEKVEQTKEKSPLVTDENNKENSGGNKSSGNSPSPLTNPDHAIFGDEDLHPVEILGSYECVEAALYSIRQIIYTSILSQYGPALIPGPGSSHFGGQNSYDGPGQGMHNTNGYYHHMSGPPNYHPTHQSYMAAVAAYSSNSNNRGSTNNRMNGGNRGQSSNQGRVMPQNHYNNRRYYMPSIPPPPPANMHHHHVHPGNVAANDGHHAMNNAWTRSFNSRKHSNNLYHHYHMHHQYQKAHNFRRNRRYDHPFNENRKKLKKDISNASTKEELLGHESMNPANISIKSKKSKKPNKSPVNEMNKIAAPLPIGTKTDISDAIKTNTDETVSHEENEASTDTLFESATALSFNNSTSTVVSSNAAVNQTDQFSSNENVSYFTANNSGSHDETIKSNGNFTPWSTSSPK